MPPPLPSSSPHPCLLQLLSAVSAEYCSSLCSPSPAKSRYLQTLGQELLPEIGVIWTGGCPARLDGYVQL